MNIFDTLNIFRDLLKEDSTIKSEFNKCDDKSIEFKLLKETILDRKYLITNMLMNNHYVNPFIDIYFILGNPYLFTNDIFEILYNRRKEINKIPSYIKSCWSLILNSNLIKFYNNTLINKWLETLQFNMITKSEFKKYNLDNKLYNKYLEIFDIFDKNVCIIRRFVNELKKQITNENHPGCSNLNIKYYYYFIKLNTGLTIDNNRIKILFNFALKDLKQLNKQQLDLIQKIRPDLKNQTNLLDIIKDDPQYKFKSKEEFINTHKLLIDKLHEFFIDKMQIKEFSKTNLVFIDDPNLSGAYWAYDTFYLNSTNWDKVNTYESLALTLHEAIPGHHTQLNYSVHSENKDINILYHLFGTTNGFCEGWALFIESIYPYYTDIEHVGRLQYEILRTIRIIIDILLNILGKDIKFCLEFMKKYVTMDDKILESELYRYITIPGQALCYKIGCEIFRKIKQNYMKKHRVTDNIDNLIDLYKQIIYNKEKSLDALLIEYNIQFDEVFV